MRCERERRGRGEERREGAKQPKSCEMEALFNLLYNIYTLWDSHVLSTYT